MIRITKVRDASCVSCDEADTDILGVDIEFEEEGRTVTAFVCFEHLEELLEAVYHMPGFNLIRQVFGEPAVHEGPRAAWLKPSSQRV